MSPWNNMGGRRPQAAATTSQSRNRKKIARIAVMFLACLLWLVGPGSRPASAATVALNGDVLQVSFDTSGTMLRVVRSGTDVTVLDHNLLSVGSAAIASVRTIAVTGTSGQDNLVVDLAGGQFAPGIVEVGEDASPEIEFEVGMLGGVDTLTIAGSVGGDHLLIGNGPSGSLVQLNGDADQDSDVSATGVESKELNGSEGNDTLSGLGEQDATGPLTGDLVLLGDENDDIMMGGDGNDTLMGGNGKDQENGLLGDDTYAQGPFRDGADWIGINFGPSYTDGGTDTVDYGQRALDIFVSLDNIDNDGETDEVDPEQDNVYVGVENVTTGAGPDIIWGSTADNEIITGGSEDQAYGDAGADIISGGSGEDPSLGGGPGDDFVEGGLDSDSIIGGEGLDALNGNGGEDTVWGEGDNDVIHGGGDSDVLYAGAGNDQVWGESGLDELYGEEGNDFLKGGDDDDTLAGQDGNDEENGDDADDTYLQGSAPDGNDKLSAQNPDGDQGDDTVDYSARGEPVVVTVGAPFTGDGAVGESDDVRLGVELVLGSELTDQITGGNRADWIEGNGGDDTLRGGGGNDQLVGGGGGDSLFGDAGNDGLSGDLGADELLGGDGNDLLQGGPDDDKEAGEAGDDGYLQGDAPEGSDLISVAGIGEAADLGVDSVQYGTRTLDVEVSLDSQPNDGDMGIETGATEGDNVGSTVEIIWTGAGNDHVTGNADPEQIYTSAGVDSIVAGGGNDTVRAGDDDDDASGGSGNDDIAGGAGFNDLTGGSGKDTIDYSGTVAVNVNLAKGTAQGAATDTLAGFENVRGSDAADTIKGSAAAANRLEGGLGKDVINGNTGGDTIKGGGGADTLTCGGGKDSLSGDSGNDTFYTREGSRDSVNGGTGKDSARVDRRIDVLKSVEKLLA